MSWSLRTVAAAAFIAVPLLIGCGDSTGSDAAAPPATPASSATATPDAPSPELLAALSEDRDLCDTQVRPIMEALQDLEGDLAIGINVYDYGDRVRAISRAYARMDVEELGTSGSRLMSLGHRGSSCLAVAVSLEEAFNAHARAQTIWSDCIDDPAISDCTSGPTNTQLQKQWARAGTLLARGTRQLRTVQDATTGTGSADGIFG